MTDYNDGNWHGWNGGECPVHPDTEVEGIYMKGDGIAPSSPFTERAGSFDWAYKNRYRLVAFRVIEEYREPREFWITIPDADRGSYGIVHTKPDGIYLPGFIHVREVIE